MVKHSRQRRGRRDAGHSKHWLLYATIATNEEGGEEEEEEEAPGTRSDWDREVAAAESYTACGSKSKKTVKARQTEVSSTHGRDEAEKNGLF